MGLSLNFSASSGPKTVDLTPAVTDFTSAVKEWPGRSVTMEIKVKYLRRYLYLIKKNALISQEWIFLCMFMKMDKDLNEKLFVRSFLKKT